MSKSGLFSSPNKQTENYWTEVKHLPVYSSIITQYCVMLLSADSDLISDSVADMKRELTPPPSVCIILLSVTLALVEGKNFDKDFMLMAVK